MCCRDAQGSISLYVHYHQPQPAAHRHYKSNVAIVTDTHLFPPTLILLTSWGWQGWVAFGSWWWSQWLLSGLRLTSRLNWTQTQYLVLVFPVENISFWVNSQCNRTCRTAVLLTNPQFTQSQRNNMQDHLKLFHIIYSFMIKFVQYSVQKIKLR